MVQLTCDNDGNVRDVCSVPVNGREHISPHDSDAISGVGAADHVGDAVYCTHDVSLIAVFIQLELNGNL